MVAEIISLESDRALDIIERNRSVKDQLLHESTEMSPMSGNCSLTDTDAWHKLSLLFLEFHNGSLEIVETFVWESEVFGHLGISFFMGKFFSSFSLEFVIESHGFALDIVSQKAEDFFNVSKGWVSCVYFFLQFTNLFFDVECWLSSLFSYLFLLRWLLFFVHLIGPKCRKTYQKIAPPNPTAAMTALRALFSLKKFFQLINFDLVNDPN